MCATLMGLQTLQATRFDKRAFASIQGKIYIPRLQYSSSQAHSPHTHTLFFLRKLRKDNMWLQFRASPIQDHLTGEAKAEKKRSGLHLSHSHLFSCLPLSKRACPLCATLQPQLSAHLFQAWVPEVVQVSVSSPRTAQVPLLPENKPSPARAGAKRPQEKRRHRAMKATRCPG